MNQKARKQIAQQIANIASYEMGYTDNAADACDYAHVSNQTQLWIRSVELGTIYARISRTGKIVISTAERQTFVTLRNALEADGYRKSIKQIQR